jgi:uncharacterized protein YegJ (DUF2314 family)
MRFSILALMALLVIGCNSKDTPTVIEREGQPPVVGLADNDPQIRAAEKKAQDTLEGFIAQLQKKPADTTFFIKTGIPTPDGSKEHIWVENLTYRDGVFSGFLGNEPLNLPNLKVGSVVKVKRADVEDWIIAKGGEMTGGFTTKVIDEKTSKQ